MKDVIINADDFGLSSGINKGIIKAYKEGILTSATLMANMEAFEQAVDLAKYNSGLGVGVHLNLLRGKPLLPENQIRSLLKDGYFLGKIGKFISRLYTRSINPYEAEMEWRAQIEKTLKTGLKITHLDSEKHLHCFPSLLRITVKLSREYNINRIRVIGEPVSLFSNGNQKGSFCLLNPQFYKTVCLNYFCRTLQEEIKKSCVRTPDRFYGVLYSGKMDQKKYDMIFERIEEGVTEIMCHPGYMDALSCEKVAAGGNYYINQFRDMELQALLLPSLKTKASKLCLNLIHYGDLDI